MLWEQSSTTTFPNFDGLSTRSAFGRLLHAEVIWTGEGPISIFSENTWHQAGGLCYRVIPLGRRVERFCVEPPADVELNQVQEDLDRLTDYLYAQVGGLKSWNLTLPELRNRVRRKVLAWLGMIGVD